LASTVGICNVLYVWSFSSSEYRGGEVRESVVLCWIWVAQVNTCSAYDLLTIFEVRVMRGCEVVSVPEAFVKYFESH